GPPQQAHASPQRERAAEPVPPAPAAQAPDGRAHARGRPPHPTPSAPSGQSAASAPRAPAASAASSAPRPAPTADALRQGWEGVLEAVKAKRRVAWILLSNASVVSLDEGVLTLRFPRQGDVKGFQSSGYEDLLRQVLEALFGVNVVVRAVS